MCVKRKSNCNDYYVYGRLGELEIDLDLSRLRNTANTEKCMEESDDSDRL